MQTTTTSPSVRLELAQDAFHEAYRVLFAAEAAAQAVGWWDEGFRALDAAVEAADAAVEAARLEYDEAYEALEYDEAYEARWPSYED